MKITTLITKQAIIQLVLAASLLLTASCDTCMQKPLGREKESANVTLETYSVTRLGSINNDQVVIEVQGKIQENYINETSTLCVIVIQENESVLAAANEFRATHKVIDKDNPYVLLPTNKGAIYHASDLNANKQGSVSAKLFLQSELQPGKYKVYLAVHSVSYGTYPSLKGGEVEKPDVISIVVPTIQMDTVKQEIKVDAATKTRLVQIDARATATNHGGRKGGFLFIEEKDPKTKPIEMLAQLIKDKKSIPTITTEFQQLEDMAGIIIHSFKDTAGSAGAKDDNHLSGPDKNKIFKKGVAYQVYAYLVDQVDIGELNFIISKEDNIVLKIPKPEVTLSMKEAKIVEMIRYLGDGPLELEHDYNHTQFELKGEIITNKDTDDPKVGFFIAKNSPVAKDEAVNKIVSLLALPSTKNNIHTNGSDLAYMAGSVNTEEIGVKDYKHNINKIPLELDKNYHVYFWLLDKGGQIFVSDNYQTLSIPSVELDLTNFDAYRDAGELYIDCKGTIKFPQLPGGKSGYIVVEKTTNLNDGAFLSEILGNAKSKIPQGILGKEHIVFFGSELLGIEAGTISVDIKVDNKLDDAFKTVPSDTPYTVYLCCFNKEFLFFKKASAGVEFIWHQAPNEEKNFDVRKIPIDDTGAIRKDYLVSYKKGPANNIIEAHILEKNPIDASTKEIKYENNKKSRKLITAILTTNTTKLSGGSEAVFKGSPPKLKRLVKNFINAMPQVS